MNQPRNLKLKINSEFQIMAKMVKKTKNSKNSGKAGLNPKHGKKLQQDEKSGK